MKGAEGQNLTNEPQKRKVEQSKELLPGNFHRVGGRYYQKSPWGAAVKTR